MPNHSWFSDLAFGADSAGLGAVAYRSHREALRTSRAAIEATGGVGVLIGIAGSGKSTVARELCDAISSETAVAIVDGIRLNAGSLLSEILAQFGYVVDAGDADELLSTVQTFAEEQRQTGDSPVIVVDNADRMYPSGLRALNALAALTVDAKGSVRLLLTGEANLRRLLAAESLSRVRERIEAEHVLEPMTVKESMIYLHSRLAACGVRPPDSVFPVNVCDHLHARSGGWPGKLNAVAMETIEGATKFPVSLSDLGEVELPELPYKEPERVPELTEPIPELAPDLDISQRFIAPPIDAPTGRRSPSPKIIITKDGKTISTYTFSDKKIIIGRSEFADVIVSDSFVSKLHALVLVFRDALVLLDLNSANGLTVNSTVVRSTILQSGDIIVLGNHRLKVENAPAISRDVARVLQSGDTLRMKSLMDDRRRRLLKAKLKLADN